MIKFKILKINYKLISLLSVFILLFTCIFIHTYAKSQENSAIEVPIIMYHSVLKSQSGKYIIHPDILEKDLQYIQKNGYTTITMTDLIDYVYNNKALPQKPIILTFDDGHYNNLTYVLPLLQKYNMVAIISIVGKYTDTYSETDEANPNYSYLRWKDIKYLIDSGNIEFQNHTYNLHNLNSSRKGCMKNSYESLDYYNSLLYNDIYKLQKEFETNVNYIPNTFTYPFGAISKESLDVIKRLGFKASLSCNEGINLITQNPECLYELKRFNRPSYISTEQFFKNMQIKKSS